MSSRQGTAPDERTTAGSMPGLLIMLLLPASILAALLYLQPDTAHPGRVQFAVVSVLGSVAWVLASLFVLRSRRGPDSTLAAAGLGALGILAVFQALSPPQSNVYAWQHVTGLAIGAAFLLAYASGAGPEGSWSLPKKLAWIPLAPLLAGHLGGVLPMVLSDSLPVIVEPGAPFPLSWTAAVPTALLLISAVGVYRRYLRDGKGESLLLAAAAVFLVQSGLFFILARPWTLTWWSWQVLGVLAYLAVIVLVLRDYARAGGALAAETDRRRAAEANLLEAEERWRSTLATERGNSAEARTKLQNELNRTSRLAAIGEVSAGIIHEINNPLTGVIAFAQMLAQMDVPENMREAVEVINDGASRVVGVVDKLLTFARRDRPDKEYSDLNDLLTNTLAIRSYELRTRDIAESVSLAPDLPRTMVNIGQIQQVFLNVIINAEQAMAGAHGYGELKLTTENLGHHIRISFADTGPGIPDEIIDRLFDPFFTTKDAAGGTGLGLSVSRGIIEEHGGKMYARSVPDKGATFVIDLPIVEPAERLEAAGAPEGSAEAVTGARILVVDDEPHIRTALDRVLTREGHEVATISSGVQALDRLQERAYDLILLDLKMPELSGIDFYERMKEIAPALRQRVICVTGDVISETNKDFLEKTGIPCVTKPFSVQELVDQIRRVLEVNGRCASHVY